MLLRPNLLGLNRGQDDALIFRVDLQAEVVELVGQLEEGVLGDLFYLASLVATFRVSIIFEPFVSCPGLNNFSSAPPARLSSSNLASTPSALLFWIM